MEEKITKFERSAILERIKERAEEGMEKLDLQTKENIEMVDAIKDFLIEMAEMIDRNLAGIGQLKWVMGEETSNYFLIKRADGKITAHIPTLGFDRAEGAHLFNLEDIFIKEAGEIQRILEEIDQKGIRMQSIL